MISGFFYIRFFESGQYKNIFEKHISNIIQPVFNQNLEDCIIWQCFNKDDILVKKQGYIRCSKHKRKDFQIKKGQDNRNIRSDKAYQRLLKGNSSSVQLSLKKLFEALEALDEFSDVR